MFPGSHFPGSHYAGGHFPNGAAAVVVHIDRSGHVPRPGARRNARLPEDYERERRMLEEYLESLEQKAKPQRLPARQAKKLGLKQDLVVVPRLTEAMAAVARGHELQRIEQAARAAAQDKDRARQEAERRRRAATAAVLLLTH